MSVFRYHLVLAALVLTFTRIEMFLFVQLQLLALPILNSCLRKYQTCLTIQK
jgi:hypothetical protein